MNRAALVQRLCRDYFSDPLKQVSLKKGEYLLRKEQINDRLYYVLEGSFVSSIEVTGKNGEKESVAIFNASKGTFLGVNSFFSCSDRSSTDVVALSDARLAWIDRTTPPVNEEDFGNIQEQFFPIIMAEMAGRQLRLTRSTVRHELALRHLHEAEQNLAMLGHLSAGLVHELNNAIGVMVRTSERVQAELRGLLSRYEPEQVPWFDQGVNAGQPVGSKMVREKAKELVKRFNIPSETAKGLARMLGDKHIETLPEFPDDVVQVWDVGRDCHDMGIAARHAASIVRSVKLLGGDAQKRTSGVNINETILEALSLLQSQLREVQVTQKLDPALPAVYGNKTEFIQIWLNIVKNAWDAVKEGHTPSPMVCLKSVAREAHVEVRVDNNGPPIPEALRTTLFQPSITTKKGEGESMGLGLGLYMVKKIIDSYKGSIEFDSTPERTRFIVRLPIEAAVPDPGYEAMKRDALNYQNTE